MMKNYVLDFKGVRTRRGAHRYMAKALGFPEYYGKNLDALYDCLGEMSDVSVEIRNIGLGVYGQKILKAFQDRADEGPDFELTFVPPPEK